MRHPLKRSVLFALAAVLPFALHAEPDLERGKQLHRQCALCHGQHSQGILGGKYPRMAGLPEYYLLKMIERYKDGTLNYPAMTVVGGLRNLSQADIESLVAYISLIDLDEVAPLDIATAPGDIEEGEEMYKNDCRSCHGRKGEGNSRKESPPLRGQYTEYLARQIDMFKRKQREHALDPEDETFVDYSDEELRDILAYISTLDDN
jgi:cytochrome c553